MEREIFSNNKIREALCQFTFQEVKDNTIYGRYWDKLCNNNNTKEFSTKENISSFQFTMKGDNPGEIIPSMVNAMKFSTEDKRKVIQLHQKNLSIHQLGHYEKWEVYSEGIKYGLNTLTSLDTDIKLNRIDLRAINEFNFENKITIKDYFNIYPLFDNNMPFNSPNTEIKLSEKLDKDNYYIITNISVQNEGETTNVIVDISFVAVFTEFQMINNYEDVKECLEYGHDNLNKVFYNIITDKTKSLIK